MTNSSIQRILVPVDYSPESFRAVNEAAKLALKAGADLLIFHAFGVAETKSKDGNATTELHRREQQKLEQFLADVEKRFPKLCIEIALEFGVAAEWIPMIVESRQVDFVVMATDTTEHPADHFFGGVASHVIQKVSCPVLVIPRECRSLSISEVVFATDFHFTENAALNMAPFLKLIDLYQPFVHVANFNPERIPAAHHRNVEELKMVEMLQPSKHTFHYVQAENPSEGLIEFIENNHCDLLVTLTRHYSFIEGLFHESFTNKMLLRSNIPLLVLHEQSE